MSKKPTYTDKHGVERVSPCTKVIVNGKVLTAGTAIKIETTPKKEEADNGDV